MFNRIKVAAVPFVGTFLVAVGNLHAAIPAEVTSLSTADVDTIMGYVIVALATMWAYRKVIKTMNRS